MYNKVRVCNEADDFGFGYMPLSAVQAKIYSHLLYLYPTVLDKWSKDNLYFGFYVDYLSITLLRKFDVDYIRKQFILQYDDPEFFSKVFDFLDSEEPL